MKKLGKILISTICVFFIIFFSGCSISNIEKIHNEYENEQKEKNELLSEQEGNIKLFSEGSGEGGHQSGYTQSDSSNNIDKNVENEPKTISIAAVGDIMCHSDNLRYAYDEQKGEYDFTGYFEYVKPIISEADLAIANLETVTAGEAEKYTSFPLFNTPDAIVEALSYTGFDVLTTANNHCLDRGKDGLIRTIETIQDNNMVHVGTAAEPGTRFITMDVKGFKISMLAYTYGCNGNLPWLSSDEQKYMVNLIDEDAIKEDIEKAVEADADVVIVSMHWGTEYHREPNIHQTDLADRLFEWGADIVLGSHPHVIQKSEVVEVQGKERYIVYSMGNFISNYRREDQADRMNKVYTEDGVIVKIDLEKGNGLDPGDVVIRSVTHIPTWVDKYISNGKKEFKILPISYNIFDEGFINESNRIKVKHSYKNTMELMVEK